MSDDLAAKLKSAEETNRLLVNALLPFALVAEKDDLKAAMLASDDQDTFEMQAWFERLCERARMVLLAKAPGAMRSADNKASVN